LVYAIKHLHDQNIAHCDIKPGNIFFDELFNIKLGDLGCALQLKGKNYGVTKCFGTKTYMAPEVFKASVKTPFSPFAADIYALGATLYFMLTGCTPQSAETSETTEEDSEDDISPGNAYIGDLECLDLLTLDIVET
jgi:serine/threonine protein kinase